MAPPVGVLTSLLLGSGILCIKLFYRNGHPDLVGPEGGIAIPCWGAGEVETDEPLGFTG